MTQFPERIAECLLRAMRFDFRFMYAQDSPSLFDKIGSFSVIAFCVAMPVSTVDFKRDVPLWNQEIHAIAVNLAPLFEWNIETVKFNAHEQFNRRLTFVSVVARVRAEATDFGFTGRLAELFATYDAGYKDNRSTAQFRTELTAFAVLQFAGNIFPTTKAWNSRFIFKVVNGFLCVVNVTIPRTESFDTTNCHAFRLERFSTSLAFNGRWMFDASGVVAVTRAIDLPSVSPKKVFVAKSADHKSNYSIDLSESKLNLDCRCTEGISAE